MGFYLEHAWRSSSNYFIVFCFGRPGPTQSWTGLVNLQKSPHEMVHQWWICQGQPSAKYCKVSLKSKMLGEPWRSLWPCRTQGVKPVGFAGAVQPWPTPPFAVQAYLPRSGVPRERPPKSQPEGIYYTTDGLHIPSEPTNVRCCAKHPLFQLIMLHEQPQLHC